MIIVGLVIKGEKEIYKILKPDELKIYNATIDDIVELSRRGIKVFNRGVIDISYEDKCERIVVIKNGKKVNKHCLIGKVGTQHIGVDSSWNIRAISEDERNKKALVYDYLLHGIQIHDLLRLISEADEQKNTSENKYGKYTGDFISNDTMKSLSFRSIYKGYINTFVCFNGKLEKVSSAKLDDLSTDNISTRFGLYRYNGIPVTGEYCYRNKDISQEELLNLSTLSYNYSSVCSLRKTQTLFMRDKISNDDVPISQSIDVVKAKLEKIDTSSIIYYSQLYDRNENVLLTRVINKNSIQYKVVSHTDTSKNRDSKVTLATIESIYKDSHKYNNVVKKDGKIIVYGLDGAYEYDINRIYDEYNTRPVELSHVALTNRMLGKNYVEDINSRGELIKLEGDSKILTVDSRCKTILKNSIRIKAENLLLILPPTIKKIHLTALQVDFRQEPAVLRLNGAGILKHVIPIINRETSVILEITRIDIKDAKAIGDLYKWTEERSTNRVSMTEDAEIIKYEVAKEMLKVLSVEILGSFNIFNKPYSERGTAYKMGQTYLASWDSIKKFIRALLYSKSDKQGQEFIDKFISYIEERNKSLDYINYKG